MCVMFLIFIFSFTCYVILSSGDQEPSKYLYGANEKSILNGYLNLVMKKYPLPQNFSYIDRAENRLVMPAINKFYEEHKTKRKTGKKTSKSTIQKIIKKNRVKAKKLYIVTSKSTPPPKLEYENVYAQEDSKWNDESPTTQPNQKKKLKRWSSKFARYPMPFQKLQSRKDFVKRSKRSEERTDIFLLKDLDEIEFLSNEKGVDAVKAHVKKYWEIN